jgi:hypothetical protein
MEVVDVLEDVCRSGTAGLTGVPPCQFAPHSIDGGVELAVTFAVN